MRRFSSYGPVDTDIHYYVPRQALVDQAITHLIGQEPDKGGHYFAVWAPRQRVKSWLLNRALWQIRGDARYAGFDVLKINLEHLKLEQDIDSIAQWLAQDILEN